MSSLLTDELLYLSALHVHIYTDIQIINQSISQSISW